MGVAYFVAIDSIYENVFFIFTLGRESWISCLLKLWDKKINLEFKNN